MSNHHLYNQLERLGSYLRIDSRQALNQHGLQPIQLEVLHYLSMCNRFSDTPAAVTEYLGQTKGTVSQTIKLLESRGLLEKQDDPADKRIAHLKLTASGEDLLNNCLPTPLFLQAEESLSVKEKQQIQHALSLLLSRIVQKNQLQTFGLCKTCRHNRYDQTDGYFCDLLKLKLQAEDTELICREHQYSD